MKNMFIDTFKTTADRIAFENRGKGITSPDVQSAIEEVYEKAVSGGGNGGGNGGDDNVIVWVSKVTYDLILPPHNNMWHRSDLEIDVDPRFNHDNIFDYDHFVLRGPNLYNNENRGFVDVDTEAMLTSVFIWDKIFIEYYSNEEPFMMHIQYTNLSEKNLYAKQGDTVILLSVKK